jgi:hypothetical protein
MNKPYETAPETYVLPTFLPIPGAGVLPVNAYLIRGEQPVLVDTGLGIEQPDFLANLESLIDPREIRWVWLTHDDADHTGSIQRVLEVAPQARLATHALSALRQMTVWPVPLDRVYAMAPGDTLDVGDRKLHAVRPVTFDNPMSLGIFDDRTSTLFSVDSFGAVLPGPSEYAHDYDRTALAQGMIAWATIDSPWVHVADQGRFDQTIERVRSLAPRHILSAHLPPAVDATEQFLGVVSSVPSAEPAVSPNHAMFQQMLAAMAAPAGA